MCVRRDTLHCSGQTIVYYCRRSGQTIVYAIDNTGASTSTGTVTVLDKLLYMTLTTVVLHRALSPIDNCNVILWFGSRAVRGAVCFSKGKLGSPHPLQVLSQV